MMAFSESLRTILRIDSIVVARQVRDVLPRQEHGQKAGAMRERLIEHEPARQCQKGTESLLCPQRAERPCQPMQPVKLILILTEDLGSQSVILAQHRVEVVPIAIAGKHLASISAGREK